MDSTDIKLKAQELFSLCDKGAKGFITKLDLQKSFLSDEVSLTPEHIEQVFDSLDGDHNGYLTFDEFISGFGSYLGIDEKSIQELKDSNAEEFTDGNNENEFNTFMNGINAKDFFIDEDVVKSMWTHLHEQDPNLVTNFESFLAEISAELKKRSQEQSSLLEALKTRSEAHDEQVRKLYEEMEVQIKMEKERILSEEKMKEKKLRDELEDELKHKDVQLLDMIQKQQELTNKLKILNSTEVETKHENQRLQKERDFLEHRLLHQQELVEDLQDTLLKIRQQNKEERKQRAKVALSVSETISQEREALVKQLDMLRTVNTRLLDERDEMLQRELSFNDLEPSENCKHSPRLSPSIHSPRTPRCVHIQGSHSDYCSLSSQSQDIISPQQAVGLQPDDMEANGYEYDDQLIQAQQITPRSLPNFESRSLLEELLHSPSTGSIPDVPPLLLGNIINSEIESGGNSLITSDDDNFFAKTSKEYTGPKVSTMIYHGSPPKDRVPERVFKIVFIGDSGVGKSTFIRRFCTGEFKDKYSATVGLDFQVKSVEINDKLICIQLWDTAGQERFRSICKQYYRKADGVLIVFDVTTESSFKNMRGWITSVKEEADENVAMVFVGNKIDLCENDEDRVIKKKDGEKLAQELETEYFETSAKTGHGVFDVIEKVAVMLLEKQDEDMEKLAKFQIQANDTKKKCC